MMYIGWLLMLPLVGVAGTVVGDDLGECGWIEVSVVVVAVVYCLLGGI